MALNTAPIIVPIEARNKTGKGLTSVQKNLKSFAAFSTRAGLGMTAAITTPLAMFERGILSTAFGASESLAYMKANIDQNGVSLRQLQQQTISTASSNIKTVRQIADMNKELGKGGMKSTEISALMTPAVNLATVVEGETALVAKTLSTINAVYPEITKTTRDASRAMDMVAATVTGSPQDFDDYSDAMQHTIGVAKSMGMTFKELNQSIGLHAFFGIKGSRVGAQTKAQLRMFTEQKKMAELFGLQGSDERGRLKKPSQLFREMSDRLYAPGVSQQERLTRLKSIFGRIGITGASAAMLDLQQPKGKASFEKMADTLERSEGLINRMINTLLGEGLFGTYKKMAASFDAMKVRIGFAQEGMLTTAMKGLTTLFNAIGVIPKPIIQGLTVFAAGLVAMGPALLIAGTLANIVVAFSLAAGPITAMVSGAGKLAVVGKVLGAVFSGPLLLVMGKLLLVVGVITGAVAALVGMGQRAAELNQQIETGTSKFKNLEELMKLTGDETNKATGLLGIFSDMLKNISQILKPLVDWYYARKDRIAGEKLQTLKQAKGVADPTTHDLLTRVMTDSAARRGTNPLLAGSIYSFGGRTKMLEKALASPQMSQATKEAEIEKYIKAFATTDIIAQLEASKGAGMYNEYGNQSPSTINLSIRNATSYGLDIEEEAAVPTANIQ